MIKDFLINDKNIERNSYLWNMAGSLLSAFQSVVMLMILTRTVGLIEAGIFTIAFANANLFMNIGKYGMRFFQVSDVNEQFSFSEYKRSRVISCAAMMIVSIGYVLFASVTNSYSLEKTLIIIWMCAFKLIDAAEDVYHGMYQLKGRLDIASKALTIRMFLTILIFALGLVIWKNLLWVLIITTIVTTLLFILFTKWTLPSFPAEKEPANKKHVWALLKICFPLFAGAFLSFYIGNAPKYAIDAMLTDELQACYGFIAMPVFVIGLLNTFIFNPMLVQMSILWKEYKIKAFVTKTIRQVGIVGIITVICIIGAYLLGVPVLSWLYNTDLAPYKTELLILLLGGGFLGLSGLLNAVITIIRYQSCLMWGYAAIAVIACLFSNRIVGNYGMIGAAVLYTTLMGLLCIVFAGLFIYGVQKSRPKHI